jgi:hypothetical protein
MTNGAGFPGSPSSTAICAPGGRLSGAGPHLMSPVVTTTCLPAGFAAEGFVSADFGASPWAGLGLAVCATSVAVASAAAAARVPRVLTFNIRASLRASVVIMLE